MKIYIVRHGETEENVKKTYYGSIDCNLTERGKTQAKALGNKLKNIEFDKIFCSERIRAKETLRDISSEDDVIIDSRINERDFGIFEGRTFSELQIELKEEYDKWTVDWKDYCPENGESFRGVYKRVRSFMEDMKKEEDENKNILVCTHGGIIRAIYAYILDENLDTYWRFASKNADISVINLEYGYFYIDSIIPVE
ncbi:MAG: alpha-ribazole phosphatase [Clostridium sp.]|uniref:alpha-ribazole phosphatase n=1 Tax=Clostridium sp. TaxID=1506 RepID=UPI003053034B